MPFQPATLKEDGAGAGEAAGEKATSPTQNLEDEEDSEEGEEEDDEEALAEKFSEAFNQIDIDSEGSILSEQLGAVLECLGMVVGQDELEELIADMYGRMRRDSTPPPLLLIIRLLHIRVISDTHDQYAQTHAHTHPFHAHAHTLSRTHTLSCTYTYFVRRTDEKEPLAPKP